MTNGTVLLAGAGIGGVAAALALLRRGIDVELHEQSPQLGEVGAGIMLTPNAMRVVADLGLAEAVAAVAMEPEVSTYRRYDTGEVIMTAPLRGTMAARYGASESVDWLVARGADTRLRNDRDMNAADFARSAGRDRMAQQLAALAAAAPAQR